MQKKILFITLVGMFLTGCGIAGSEMTGIEATSSSYVAAQGNVLLAGGGNCVRTGGFSSDDTIGACEGEEEVVAKVVAEPEPVVAPPPPPPPPPPPVVAEPATVDKVVLSGRALFPFDSAQLSSQGDEEMEKLISKLQTYKDIELVDVIGHADSRGSVEYNQSLSERRAETVKGKLEESFPQVPITATGLGETAPVASNDTEDGRRLNRRVEIRVEAVN